MTRRAAIAGVALALLASAGHAGAAPPKARADVARAVRAIHASHRGYGERLERVSALFLGATYQFSPLGEGPGARRDPDPLERFDRFDCVTYVEQVMALAATPDPAKGHATLQRIRYRQGRIGYGRRNHIMMAQWIPENVRAGFVRDVTRDVGRGRTRLAHLPLRSSDFETPKGRSLDLAPGERPVGRHAVPIVSPSTLAARVDAVPHGTLLTTIRAARAGTPYRASHVGLVVVVDGKRRIRHAFKPKGAIIEEPLRRFVARAARYRSWRVSGFNLLQARAPRGASGDPSGSSKPLR